MISGVTQLMMTKADVLDDFDTIKVAVAYRIKGEETHQIPFEINAPIEPIYEEFKGWKKPLAAMRREEELPAELMTYVRFIEKATGVPVTIISIGPNREQTITRFKKI
jgi:adenylosuccinate synthase